MSQSFREKGARRINFLIVIKHSSTGNNNMGDQYRGGFGGNQESRGSWNNSGGQGNWNNQSNWSGGGGGWGDWNGPRNNPRRGDNGPHIPPFPQHWQSQGQQPMNQGGNRSETKSWGGGGGGGGAGGNKWNQVCI